MSRSDERVAVGRLLKPRGIRGEAFLHPLTDFEERFESLSSAVCEFPDGRTLDVRVSYVRRYGKRLAVKLKGVNTPEEAADYRGCLLTVPRDEVHELPDDTFYVFDVEGLPVVGEAGEALGTVREVLTYPANDVFVVTGDHGELMVPAVKEWVEVRKDRVVIRDPEGLGFKRQEGARGA